MVPQNNDTIGHITIVNSKLPIEVKYLTLEDKPAEFFALFVGNFRYTPSLIRVTKFLYNLYRDLYNIGHIRSKYGATENDYPCQRTPVVVRQIVAKSTHPRF